MIVYGIRTCDTCRKALAALRAAGYPAELRDLRESPLTRDERADCLRSFGETLVNRSSTTWRGLSPSDRALSPDDLLAAHPTVMKRPLIVGRDKSGAQGSWLGWGPAVRLALVGEV